jgi:hypothetical protein
VTRLRLGIGNARLGIGVRLVIRVMRDSGSGLGARYGQARFVIRATRGFLARTAGPATISLLETGSAARAPGSTGGVLRMTTVGLGTLPAE